jgi:hypothetical protein
LLKHFIYSFFIAYTHEKNNSTIRLYLKTTLLLAQFKKTNGIEGGNANCIAYFQGKTWGVSSGHLFVSLDEGENWEKVKSALCLPEL